MHDNCSWCQSYPSFLFKWKKLRSRSFNICASFFISKIKIKLLLSKEIIDSITAINIFLVMKMRVKAERSFSEHMDQKEDDGRRHDVGCSVTVTLRTDGMM